LDTVDVDELTVGRSPEFWGLCPISCAETAAGLLLAAGLTAPTEQPGLAVAVLDEDLLSGVGFAEISHRLIIQTSSGGGGQFGRCPQFVVPNRSVEVLS
jgi:hypothetical protein